MTETREGTCAKCSQRRPLFELSLNAFEWDENGTAWVCVRCYSDGEQVAENAPHEMEGWLPPRPNGWSPWIEPQLDHHRERPIAGCDGTKIRDGAR